jgi:hypothetical protein
VTSLPSPHGEPSAELRERRWLLIRDLAGFSVKLLLEAVRDLALIPLAVVAGAAGLVVGGDRPDRWFREVLELGRRFDAWLNLFGDGASSHGASLDAHLERVESVLREQAARGGVTAQARQAIDRALDAIERAASRRRPGGPPPA